MGTPERKRFLETMFFYLLKVKSPEDMQLLLTEEDSWKHFVAGADLSREEEDTLREALAEIFEDSEGEEEDELQSDLQDKKERKEEDAWKEALGGNAADTDTKDENQLQNDKERFLNAYPRVRLELEERI